VEANLAGHEFAEPFLVFSSEVEMDFMQHLVGHRLGMPQVTGHGENTSQFKQKKSEVDEGYIGNGVTSDSCNALDLAEAFPEHFNGISRGPQGCNAGPIGFQFSTSDGSVCGVQVGEHVGHGDVGKAKGVVIKGSQVWLIDGC